jgi:hypothetical protein
MHTPLRAGTRQTDRDLHKTCTITHTHTDTNCLAKQLSLSHTRMIRQHATFSARVSNTFFLSNSTNRKGGGCTVAPIFLNSRKQIPATIFNLIQSYHAKVIKYGIALERGPRICLVNKFGNFHQMSQATEGARVRQDNTDNQDLCSCYHSTTGNYYSRVCKSTFFYEAFICPSTSSPRGLSFLLDKCVGPTRLQVAGLASTVR